MGTATKQLIPTDFWVVYMLRCKGGSLYTGITKDVSQRVAVHNKGQGSSYVASRLPAVLVYTDPVGDHSKALKREAEIKKMSKKDKEHLVEESMYGS